MEEDLYGDLEDDVHETTSTVQEDHRTGSHVDDLYGDLEDDVQSEHGVAKWREEDEVGSRTASPSDDLYDEIYGVNKGRSNSEAAGKARSASDKNCGNLDEARR